MASKKINADNLLDSLSDVFNYENAKRENVTTFEEVPLTSIKLDPKGEFTNLFPLEEENIQNIANSMKKKGFKKSQALTLITIEDENNNTFLGDGHNRRRAAEIANIENVPVYREVYPTRREAKIAMLELQIHRRQLTDAVKLQTVALYRQLLGDKKAENGSGKISEQIAEATGFSTRQVEKMTSILTSDDESLKNEVFSGESSINLAEKKAKESKKKKDSNDDDISESLTDNSGNPRPLMINHSDGKERPDYKLSEGQDTIRTQDRNNAYELGKSEGFEKGYADGSYAVYEKIFELFDSGLSLDEVRNHEIFNDFSYSIISKKLNKTE